MIRALLLAIAALLPASAQADSRSFMVGSFDAIRVDGPFEVHVTTGAPGARATGSRTQLDALEVAVQGGTLIVRRGSQGWGERPADAASAPVVVTVSTPQIGSALVNAGARVTIAGMKAPKISLAISGAGSLAVASAQADQLQTTLLGPGSISVAGHAQRATLVSNGEGAIDAAGLSVNDLNVVMNGQGSIHAAARYTANVNSVGLGSVTVDGQPTCKVSNAGGGPVACGVKRADQGS